MKTAVVARVTATRVARGLAVLLGLVLWVACSSESPKPSGDGTLCDVAKASTCADPTACDTTIAAACAGFSGVLTDVTVTAARDCLQSGVCGVAACLSRAQKSATPTASHKKLAKDFCATCASSVADCETSFYQRGKKLPGVLVLPYAEAVIEEIDQACTGTSGCEAKFTSCANDVIARKVSAALDSETADCVLAAFKLDDGEKGPGGTPEVLRCTSANCKGCCRNDKCETGESPSACGKNAGACQICGGAQKCMPDGSCREPCGPNNCRGCCDGDTCLEGSSATSCGEKGAACTKCPGSFVCSNHTCIDASCQATCAGCCTAAGCQTGTAANACGFDGNACIDCGFGRLCTGAASCAIDPTALWDLYVSFAVIPDTDKTGASWDILAGLPDVYMKVFTSEGASSHSGQTTTQNDATFPFWAETPLTSIKASEFLANTAVEFWDSDDFYDDFIGGCTLPLSAAVFDGSLQSYTCPASPSGVSVKFYYRMNPHR